MFEFEKIVEIADNLLIESFDSGISLKLCSMKIRENIIVLLFLAFWSGLLTSCATIVGGSKYYARVTVKDYPKAQIEYKGAYVGTGNALLKIPRAQAHRFSLVIKQEGCEPQTFNFIKRSFRGAAFIGTALGWTGIYKGVPLPWGIVVDLATGALWKPNTEEEGIVKIDYKNYNYFINYQGCPQSPVIKYE